MTDRLESARALAETGRLVLPDHTPPPVHPQPGIYETTRGRARVDRILARPPWTLAAAKAAADRAIRRRRKGGAA